MPADDREAVVHRSFDLRAFDLAARSDERHEPSRSRVDHDHPADESLDLVNVSHELGSQEHAPSSQPDFDRLILTEVELPAPTSWGQQRVTVLGVAHRLSICLAGLASGE